MSNSSKMGFKILPLAILLYHINYVKLTKIANMKKESFHDDTHRAGFKNVADFMRFPTLIVLTNIYIELLKQFHLIYYRFVSKKCALIFFAQFANMTKLK